MGYYEERRLELAQELGEQVALVVKIGDRLVHGRAVLGELEQKHARVSWFPVAGNVDAAGLRLTEARERLVKAVGYLGNCDRQAINQMDVLIDTARQRLLQASNCIESLTVCRDTLAELEKGSRLNVPRLSELLVVASRCSQDSDMTEVNNLMRQTSDEDGKQHPDLLLIADLHGRAEVALNSILAKRGDSRMVEWETRRLGNVQFVARIIIKLLEQYVLDHYEAFVPQPPDLSALRTLLSLSEFGPPRQNLKVQMQYAERALRDARDNLVKAEAVGGCYVGVKGRTKMQYNLASLHGGDNAAPDPH